MLRATHAPFVRPPFARATLYILLAAAFALAACAQSAPSNTAAPGGSDAAASTEPNTNEMLAQLPDHYSAKCLGRVEFVAERRITGNSTCGGRLDGTSDQSMKIGTACVYSGTPQSRTATKLTATGYFFCSDGTRGTVRFEERPGNGPGIAVVTSDDGRIVTLNYD